MNRIKIEAVKKSLNASITIPGSKSYTNRALLISALVGSKVRLVNPLFSDDTEAMIACLKKLGVSVSINSSSISVLGNLQNLKSGEYKLDANLSGTTLRFMLALATIIPGVKTLFGKEGLNKRPIADLVKGLRQLGAKIEYLEKPGFSPVKILSSKLNQGEILIKGSVSSQYLSAILLISPVIGEITIKVKDVQLSKPYIDMTLDIMEKFGVKVLNENYQKYITRANQKYSKGTYIIEGDYSSACYFGAIAALTKSNITLKNINQNSKQADLKFFKILDQMGNKVVSGVNQITIYGKGIKAVDVDMQDCPDQVQTLAVLAAFAKGKTQISGVQSLRMKETDRIFALTEELKKMAVKVESSQDTLTIYGGNPNPATIDTYDDHRMAMSFAIAGVKISGMAINNPDVVNKTFPEFWNMLKAIGIKLDLKDDRRNIVLIGMRGSGKTTIAKILSKRLNKKCLEMDSLIINKIGLSIADIVEKHGWDYFRAKESEITKEISQDHDKIISTGGGIIERAKNIDALKKNGFFIFLRAKAETLIKRATGSKYRPSLTKKQNSVDEIKEILNKREKLYMSVADLIIDIDNLNANQIADIILEKMYANK